MLSWLVYQVCLIRIDWDRVTTICIEYWLDVTRARPLTTLLEHPRNYVPVLGGGGGLLLCDMLVGSGRREAHLACHLKHASERPVPRARTTPDSDIPRTSLWLGVSKPSTKLCGWGNCVRSGGEMLGTYRVGRGAYLSESLN